MNPMREIILAKITVNIGAGESGPRLEKSRNLVEKLVGKKSIITRTHRRSTFGVAKGRPIGVKATLRGREATEFLRTALKALENKIKSGNFDSTGNFSFGIKEYIDIPGIKYDPDIGILGMDICATLERPGYRVKKRKIKKGKIGRTHKITKDEAIEWAKKEFNVEIVNG